MKPENLFEILTNPPEKVDFSISYSTKWDSSVVRWSSLGKPLPKLVERKFFPSTMDWNHAPTMLFGLTCEEYISSCLRHHGVKFTTQIPVELGGVRGTADILVEDDTLLEIKCTNNTAIRRCFSSKGTPKPQALDLTGYYTQLVAYRKVIQPSKTYWVLYNKTHSVWEMAELSPTKEEETETIERALHKAFLLNSANTLDDLRTTDAWPEIESYLIEQGYAL